MYVFSIDTAKCGDYQKTLHGPNVGIIYGHGAPERGSYFRNVVLVPVTVHAGVKSFITGFGSRARSVQIRAT